MLTTLIGSLITALLKVLPDDFIKHGVKSLIDAIRTKVKATPNTVDDAIVLPLLDILEKQLGLVDASTADAGTTPSPAGDTGTPQ